ncbi:hypothetical protein AgCh_034616 [Apium graveolens]
MDPQSKYMKEIEDKYAALNIDEEEDIGSEYEEEIEETESIDTRWSLVGHLLVDVPVDFNAMQNTLAGLWKPVHWEIWISRINNTFGRSIAGVRQSKDINGEELCRGLESTAKYVARRQGDDIALHKMDIQKPQTADTRIPGGH